MLISPKQIAPSQNFLKEQTVKFIFKCLHEGNTKDLPPTPLVRKDENGQLVAIDGHNLIAVRLFLGEDVEVALATSAANGLPATTEANILRNHELANKFDSVLYERKKIAAEGILTFSDLIEKYQTLFKEASALTH